MGKDKRFGITRNFAKHLVRGGVKSIPYVGNLFDEIIFGTLEGESAQKESKKLHAKLDAIAKQIDTQEGDFAEILAGLHLQADFNEEVRGEFMKIEQLLRDPENAPVPESFNLAFKKLIEQNEELKQEYEKIQEGVVGLADDHDRQDEKLNKISDNVEALSNRNGEMSEVSIVIKGKYRPLPKEAMDKIVETISKEMRSDIREIHLLYTMPCRSMRITLAVPREYAERIRSLDVGKSSTLKELGIEGLEVRSISSLVKVAFPKYWPTHRIFIGRDKELALLDDAWKADNTHIVSLVAWGGVG